MSLKRELVFYSDIGLCGTFVSWIEKATEKDFRYLEYVPLNSFPPKKRLHPVAIHKDHIHILHSSKSDPGVENRIVFIFTAENGSLVKSILTADNEKTIAELREKNRKLQMQVATTRQESEDARSGVNKTLAAMKQMQKGTQQSNPFDVPYGRPLMGGGNQPSYDYDDFDNY